MTRSDSFSTISNAGRPYVQAPESPVIPSTEGKAQSPAFTFSPLRNLSAHLFSRKSANGTSSPVPPLDRRASSILGLPLGSTPVQNETHRTGYGRPTVLDISGMIAVGTERGWVLVYNFAQEVICILGSDAIGEFYSDLQTTGLTDLPSGRVEGGYCCNHLT
jgi:hypothetical protein